VVLLVAANALATLLRFVLLRSWVFRTPRGANSAAPIPDPAVPAMETVR
jgi:hypothetical protein